MTEQPRYRFRSLAFALGTVVALAPFTAVGNASAEPTDYGNGCAVYPDDRAATIDALRFKCSVEQQDEIYVSAAAGSTPRGVTSGWVTRPAIMAAMAPPLWIGKTFYTGSNGGHLQNRITGAGIEGWVADVYLGTSKVDNEPAWILNYAPSPTPPLLDEIREVSPGVWFGLSWWRDPAISPLLLAFVVS